jgi:hypothetical protein
MRSTLDSVNIYEYTNSINHKWPENRFRDMKDGARQFKYLLPSPLNILTHGVYCALFRRVCAKWTL